MKNKDDDAKKQEEAEIERKRKQEELEKQVNGLDNFKTNIKSRKALQMAINDKSVPSSIRNLGYATNIVLMCLLALSISEFIIINKQFEDIIENVKMISISYGIQAEI